MTNSGTAQEIWTIEATAGQENRMNDITGASPDTCRACQSDIWADPELETYVDVRVLTDGTSACSYFYCGDTEQQHEPE